MGKKEEAIRALILLGSRAGDSVRKAAACVMQQ
jgi:hypothetical protein